VQIRNNGLVVMSQVIAATVLERRRKGLEQESESQRQHNYYRCISEARFFLRKFFRLLEEEAKRAGLDPLAHQMLIQIYGSETMRLRVKDIAFRLDVVPAVASGVLKTLLEKKYAARCRDEDDKRISYITITQAGIDLLLQINRDVKRHTDYFRAGLTPEQREMAIAAMLHYIQVSVSTKESTGTV
jgi:DNA-binding MarR family transcriptional regulator